MNNRMFSLWGGIFSILNTIQFLIFDLNEIVLFDLEDHFYIYKDMKVGISSWVIRNKNIISISLSSITIMVSALLLYCVHKNNYMGLLCYSVWIITYELICFSAVLLMNSNLKEYFKELSYLHLIFQISRMFLHLFFLPFIIHYTYILYKDPKTSSKTGRRRCSSISTIDSWPAVGLGTLWHKLN
ncbi:transmembrane protein 217 isoform X4 [Pteropus medius]|uniref:transmembrane protein 217 isoform X4 n=1 Tax=Pteropus vampyrus TaxID=132908 RepID=UPI00196B509A|nr:transmembrane protein 217 isoform X4 [Pteropus giganteus]XP_039712316.1 transmembrane protein 217 isoform X4 [Pteropus giganteus]XP_039712318.1 transmembrane protein 217 isoform X4 [Pteropus giganteus]